MRMGAIWLRITIRSSKAKGELKSRGAGGGVVCHSVNHLAIADDGMAEEEEEEADEEEEIKEENVQR